MTEAPYYPYTCVTHSELGRFEDAVAEWIKRGYAPLGGAAVVQTHLGYRYYQALYLKEVLS